MPDHELPRRRLSASVLCVLSFVVPAETLRVIYSFPATAPPEPILLSEAEKRVVDGEIRVAARLHWPDSECSEDFRVISIARGSFTRPGSAQRAILYSYCITGHNFGRDGFAVLEDGAVVAHVVFDGAWNSGLVPVDDVDGTGRSELLIISGGTNMGESWQVVSLVGLSDSGVRKFGQTDTYGESCTTDSLPHKTAYKLFARAGIPPAFYRERYEARCVENSSWRRSGGVALVSLQPDPVVYVRLK